MGKQKAKQSKQPKQPKGKARTRAKPLGRPKKSKGTEPNPKPEPLIPLRIPLLGTTTIIERFEKKCQELQNSAKQKILAQASEPVRELVLDLAPESAPEFNPNLVPGFFPRFAPNLVPRPIPRPILPRPVPNLSPKFQAGSMHVYARTSPKTFTSNSFFHSLSGKVSSGPPKATPALLIKTNSPAKATWLIL